MSVVVYKDGIMAADSRAYSGDSTPIGHKMKIFRLADGSLIGVTTNKPGLGEAIVNWFSAGMPEGGEPQGEIDFTALWVRTNGEVLYFYESFNPSGPLIAPYFAIGSGEKYALGALAMGASAAQAVEAACLNDSWCAAPITQLELNPPPPEEEAAPDMLDPSPDEDGYYDDREEEPGPINEEATNDA